MKRSFLAFSLVFLAFTLQLKAQNKRKFAAPVRKNIAGRSAAENLRTAVVVDERLAVLRLEPSLYARPIQRMRRGRF